MTDQEKREKVIALLERYMATPNLAGVENYGAKIVDMPAPLIIDALALLKAQEPRVMTLMEACGAEVCWIEKRVQPVITVCKVKLFAQEDYSAFINYMLPYANENIPIGKYGEKWRCWNVRPTYAQREATPWG